MNKGLISKNLGSLSQKPLNFTPKFHGFSKIKRKMFCIEYKYPFQLVITNDKISWKKWNCIASEFRYNFSSVVWPCTLS